MSPFVTRLTHNEKWVIPVSLMCLILGFLIALARVTGDNRATRLPLAGPDQQNRIAAGPIDLQEAYQKLQTEVDTLRTEKTRLEAAVSEQGKGAKVLNESLQDAKEIAGLTEVEGPGVSITLRDSTRRTDDLPMSDYVIHDIDVLKVVNELFAAGAEAISVNNKRVVGTTSFRCVGPVIHVDAVPIAPPVVIRAIGDPKALMGGMTLPNGVLDEIKSSDAAMVSIDSLAKLVIPAYSGPTTRRFAKTVTPRELSSSESQPDRESASREDGRR